MNRAQDIPWRLTETHALLQSERFVATLDLMRPGDGIGGIEVAAGEHTTRVPLDARLLQLVVEESQTGFDPPVDAYVRGDDLVAGYGRAEVTKMLPQIYWRFLAGDVLSPGGIELMASMQTRLLNDKPLTTCRSQIAAREVLHLRSAEPLEAVPLPFRQTLVFSPNDGLGAFLFRSADSDASYLEAVYPADFHRAECRLSQTHRSELTFHLFPGQLEKGVIRRGRVRGIFLPSDNDLASAAQALREFAESEPPLTT